MGKREVIDVPEGTEVAFILQLGVRLVEAVERIAGTLDDLTGTHERVAEALDEANTRAETASAHSEDE